MAISIYLPGVAGRMGQTLAQCIAEAGDLALAGAYEAPDHAWIGQSLRATLPAAKSDCVVAALPGSPPRRPAVSVHFTWPEPTLAWLDWSVENRCPMVIGTTGFEPEQIARIGQAAERIAIVMAPNMCVGVNLLFSLAEKAAAALGLEYDVEIAEMHHRFKKDAPSGTAVRLGQIVAGALGLDPVAEAVHGREGLVGERPRRQIGYHALRGGDVVGEHTVTFAGLGERVELTHRASSRGALAEGALRAARFIADKSAGLFDMQDVLGLR